MLKNKNKLKIYFTYLIFFFITVSFQYAQYLQYDEENNGYAVIYSFKQVVYDDGIERIQYLPFDVYDLKGSQVLSVGYNFDSPAIIKLPAGCYKIKLLNQAGNSISHQITVEKDSIKNFSFTE